MGMSRTKNTFILQMEPEASPQTDCQVWCTKNGTTAFWISLLCVILATLYILAWVFFAEATKLWSCVALGILVFGPLLILLLQTLVNGGYAAVWHSIHTSHLTNFNPKLPPQNFPLGHNDSFQ